jgi:hypothetical protein
MDAIYTPLITELIAQHDVTVMVVLSQTCKNLYANLKFLRNDKQSQFFKTLHDNIHVNYRKLKYAVEKYDLNVLDEYDFTQEHKHPLYVKHLYELVQHRCEDLLYDLHIATKHKDKLDESTIILVDKLSADPFIHGVYDDFF